MQTTVNDNCGLFGTRRRAVATADERFPVQGEPGYFFDPWGYRFYDPEADCDLARARLDALLLDDLPTQPPRPLVSARAIDGRLPSPSKVRAVETAMGQVPGAIRAKLLRAGATIELIPGRDVAAHPLFRHHVTGRYVGMTRFFQPFGAVAVDADDDPAATVLHELAHILDHVAGHPSHGPDWLRIWQQDLAAGKVPGFGDQRGKPGEYFAESCGRLWNPRAGVWPASRAAADFIEGLV